MKTIIIRAQNKIILCVMQKEAEKCLQRQAEVISPNQSEESFKGQEFKYTNCTFCQGIIPKYYVQRNGAVTHCSKICSEMTKIMKNENPHALITSSSDTQNKEKFSQRHWGFYKEVLRERAAPAYAFSQLTEPVSGLEPGMKLESLDINNPVNYCVATVIQVLGHRLKIRYDGFGDDSNSDVWFNFQADELYPIGWCASHGYPLQPPTGISSTLAEWKSFLTRTLTGALAAPNDLFKKVENRRALKCHSYLIGDKIEVIHPKKTSVIVPATITKSLGPYYFLVTCDSMPGISSYTFYGYADCPGIFPKGWRESKGLELVIPPEGKGDVHMLFKPDMNIDLGGLKRNRSSFKLGAKLEALYDDYVRVATVAEIFGGVALLTFDGSSDVHFVDKRCTDIYPIGWSENTDSVLFTPLGLVTFVKMVKPAKGKVQSASFATFKDLSELNLAKSFDYKQPVDQVDKILIAKSDLKPAESQNVLPSKKNLNMEKFILWLLNNYEYSIGSEVIVSRLLEKYARQYKAPCSTTGIPVILNLFPGTSSISKLFNKNYVQFILNLKASKCEKKGIPIYVKDAVDFLQKCNVSFKMGTDKIVLYMGVGDSFTLPEDQQLLFIESKARPNSNVLVVSQQINNSTLSNFLFYFGDKPCSPPFKEINTFEEFCAMIKLCTMAKPCSGISQKEVKSDFSSLFVKNNKSGVLFSRTCNLVVYSNQGSVCSQCSLCEFKINDSSELSPSTSLLNEDCRSSKDDSSLPSPDMQIFLNQWCYQGTLFDPEKISKMKPKTPKERPAEVLKCLIEILISVANSKDKLLEIIEAGFGTRIFNKAKDKVVKKGLFRFNTPKKIERFLVRLTKKLGSCENFLSLEDKDCNKDCQNNYYRGFAKKKKKEFVQVKTKSESTEANTDTTCQEANGSTSSAPVFNNNTAQLDYSSQSYKMTNNKQIILQPQAFNLSQMHDNTPCKVSESPRNDSHIYVVLNKEDNLVNPIQSNSVPSTPLLSVSTSIPAVSLHVNSTYSRQNLLSSTPKVTQMIENISKTTLLMDIDEPSRQSIIGKSEIPVEQTVMKQNNLLDLQHRDSSPHSHLYHNNNIIDMMPPTYQDVQNHNRNQYRSHQYVENICHTMEPAEKQMHVHKIHHGNARVKYVLPAQDRDRDGKQYISSHYTDGLEKKIFQGQVHYPQSTQRTVSPSNGNICSPLHSPPALRPPPSLHSRSLPLHSPPTLLASPDVRPMFDFISSSNSNPNYQNIRTLTYMQPEKTYTIAHTNVHMPKLPPNFENCQQRNQNHAKPMKFHHIERPQAQKVQYNGNFLQQHQQHQQHLEKQRISPIKTKPFIPSDKKVAYIPIQTSSKENFVYVPVNSVNDVQPVVLYQSNQNNSDQGRQIIIPLNSKDDGRSLKDKIRTPFTTVCIQGIQQANYIAKSHAKPVKNNSTFNNTPIKISLSSDVKSEYVKKTESANLSEIVKTEPCVENIESENCYKKSNDLHENVSEAFVETMSNSLRLKSEENHKKKKKRGRPPSALKTNDDNSIISNLPITCASPLTLQDSNNISNHLLLETFKKQQDRNNRIKFLIDPISKVPDLPNNPELWSPSDVKKFLLATDCNSHAEVLFREEVDGRSFLLITQEALVEFMGMRLGPALKIASYASQLRAQLRVQNMCLVDGRNSPSRISKIKKARLNDTISKLQEKKISKENSSKPMFDQTPVSFDKVILSAVEDESENIGDHLQYKNTVSDLVCNDHITDKESVKLSTNMSENKKNIFLPSENRNKTYVTDVKNNFLSSGNISYPGKFNESVTDIIDPDKKMMDLDVPYEHVKSNNYHDSEFSCIKKPPLEQFELSEPYISSQSFS